MALSKSKITIIAISGALVLVVVLFFIFAKKKTTGTDGTITAGSGGVVNVGTVTNTSNQAAVTNAEAEDMLRILRSLEKIKLDRSIINSDAFRKLTDYTVELPEPISGRNYPFAPVRSDEIYNDRTRTSQISNPLDNVDQNGMGNPQEITPGINQNIENIPEVTSPIPVAPATTSQGPGTIKKK